MDVNKLKALRLSEPFRQFYLILRDGRRLFVDLPYHMGIAPDGSHLLVMDEGSRMEHLTPDQVADVDVLQSSRG
jgi:hypothetical protein